MAPADGPFHCKMTLAVVWMPAPVLPTFSALMRKHANPHPSSGKAAFKLSMPLPVADTFFPSAEKHQSSWFDKEAAILFNPM